MGWPLPLLTSVYFLGMTELVFNMTEVVIIFLYSKASEAEILSAFVVGI